MTYGLDIQFFTLILAALSLLVSLIVLRVLVLQGQSAHISLPSGIKTKRPGHQAKGLIDDRELVAVLTAAITSAQADEINDLQLTAVLAGALASNQAAAGSSAGFVIRKIRRV